MIDSANCLKKRATIPEPVNPSKKESLFLFNRFMTIGIAEPIDFKTPYGRFMFRVKLAMNSFYVENLIEKIRIGVERAKKEGKYKGGKKGRTWKCAR